MYEILSLLMPPVIGAVIGYFTNYIAVKMLFRPLQPVKIGERTLPFTPGIIPKRQGALASALGWAVGEQLIGAEDIKAALLDPGTVERISEGIYQQIREVVSGDVTVRERITEFSGEERYEEKKEALVEFLSRRLVDKFQEMEMTQMILDEGVAAIKEKTKDSMLAMFMNDNLIHSITTPMGEKIDRYVEEEGQNKIRILLETEAEKLEAGKLDELTGPWLDQEKLQKYSSSLYRTFIEEKGDEILDSINLADIVEGKINQMAPAEVEKLVLSVMEKELGMVVKLGAVIGFVLGLLNLLF